MAKSGAGKLDAPDEIFLREFGFKFPTYRSSDVEKVKHTGNVEEKGSCCKVFSGAHPVKRETYRKSSKWTVKIEHKGSTTKLLPPARPKHSLFWIDGGSREFSIPKVPLRIKRVGHREDRLVEKCRPASHE